MTEQEIINILKENKCKGVADLFLPGEVSDWIAENLNNPSLLYLDPMGNWKYFKDTDFDDYDNVVFGLPDTFYPQKPKGGWEEFEIDEDGCYRILDTDMRFHWSEWNKPLWIYEKDENRSWYLTTFGGWQYAEPNSDFWFTQPMTIRNDDGALVAGNRDDDKPAIPSKIRFWREVR